MKRALVAIAVGVCVVATVRAEDTKLDARVEWLKKNATAFRSIDPADQDFSDLEGLRAAIGDAQVVQLGEQSHGDGATFDAKVRLIEFLHEKMGFDVLAWESGVYDCGKMDEALRNGDDAETVMRKGIFPIWHSREVVKVFEYARKTRDTYRPLTLVGFDPQFSSASAEGFAADVRTRVAKAFPAFIDDTQEKALDALATRHGDDLGEDERKAGRDEASRLVDFLSEKRADFDKALGARVTGWLEKSLRGALVFDELTKDPGAKQAMGPVLTKEMRALLNLRDRTMGENLVWLADEQWKGRKIIVWAATYHAIHGAPTIEGVAADYSGTVTMGQVAHEKLGKRLYTIGFTAHHGMVGNPNMEPWKLQAPEAGSLEAFCHDAGLKNAFLDFRGLPEDHWLRHELGARPLGYGSMKADWTRVMDGIVFTDEMYPSTPLGEGRRRQKGF